MTGPGVATEVGCGGTVRDRGGDGGIWDGGEGVGSVGTC